MFSFWDWNLREWKWTLSKSHRVNWNLTRCLVSNSKQNIEKKAKPQDIGLLYRRTALIRTLTLCFIKGSVFSSFSFKIESPSQKIFRGQEHAFIIFISSFYEHACLQWFQHRLLISLFLVYDLHMESGMHEVHYSFLCRKVINQPYEGDVKI